MKRLVRIVRQLTLALLLTVSTQLLPAADSAPALTTTEELAHSEVPARIDATWATAKIGHFEGVDGIRIHYRIIRVAPAAERGVIVISNGRTESVVKYPELIYDLTRNGYSVFIHDHRGQGLSDRLPEVRNEHELGYVDEFRYYVIDLKKFVDTIVVPESGMGKRFLLAHSMGGGIAALYLEQYPADFNAAALFSPMLQLSKNVVGTELKCAVVNEKEKFNQLQCPLLRKPQYEDVPFDENVLTHSQERYRRMRDAYDKNPEARLACPSVHWAAQACAAGRKARDDGALVKIPILVVQAGADKVVENDGQKVFCDNVIKGGGRCDFIKIEGANHELFIESDVYRTSALTRALDFFRKN